MMEIFPSFSAHVRFGQQEYNPGGGKDEVLKYLNESKKQVILAKKSLEVIMDALGMSTN